MKTIILFQLILLSHFSQVGYSQNLRISNKYSLVTPNEESFLDLGITLLKSGPDEKYPDRFYVQGWSRADGVKVETKRVLIPKENAFKITGKFKEKEDLTPISEYEAVYKNLDGTNVSVKVEGTYLKDQAPRLVGMFVIPLPQPIDYKGNLEKAAVEFLDSKGSKHNLLLKTAELANCSSAKSISVNRGPLALTFFQGNKSKLQAMDSRLNDASMLYLTITFSSMLSDPTKKGEKESFEGKIAFRTPSLTP